MFFNRRIFLVCINFIQTLVGAFEDGFSSRREAIEVWKSRTANISPRGKQLDCVPSEVYTCEEPLDLILPNVTKACNYRNQNYHAQVYRWVAGRGCLIYTPDFLYNGGVNPIDFSAGCFYENWFAPCVEIALPNGMCGCYPFDPGLEEVVQLVREAIIPSAHGRWERCFYEARDCCSHYTEDNNVIESVCPTTFDGWTCWPQTEAGTVANAVCSEFAYSNSGPTCNHFSSKECYDTGSWEIQTDYSTCSISPRLLRRYRYHIAMLAFSIACCLPAIFIFFFYKRLRVTRVALHRNLLIAITIRNILVIISRSEIYIDELTTSGDTVMSSHGLACRILAVAERIAANAVFICMLVEGVYLHRLIVAIFRQKMKVNWLYAVGAVIAVVPVVIWAVMMGLYDDHSCWVVYTVENVQWILDAPRITILLINTALFLDVLRVLLTKIRNTENSSQLSTTKATLFLMPIFGSQFLLTAIRPSTNNCTGEQVYYFFSYGVEGLQGFMVAMLFCYVNKEVRMLIKATYKKTESAIVSRARESNFKASLAEDRRMTYSTDLPQKSENTKAVNGLLNPQLHVAEIVSLPTSERLADILHPVYDTVVHGVTNDGYDLSENSCKDSDSGFAGPKVQNWDNFSSPSSSTYNNSLNETENLASNSTKNYPEKELSNKNYEKTSVIPCDEMVGSDEKYELEPENEDILDDILQYITTENIDPDLDPNLFSPNRTDVDKIVFVKE